MKREKPANTDVYRLCGETVQKADKEHKKQYNRAIKAQAGCEMSYIEKTTREQVTLLPDSLDDYVNEDNAVRVIDAFVESLDIPGMGFTKSRPAETGRPPYDPRDILKLYVYGYFNRIRSSRKLQTECARNVEVMWLKGTYRGGRKQVSRAEQRR
jgi:hypothetical protein